MNIVSNFVFEALVAVARISPFLAVAAVAAAVIHSWPLARSAPGLPSTAGVWVVCVVHVVLAAGVFWHLTTGGWLEAEYDWNDANIVNLTLGAFELVVVVGLVAFWATGNAFFYSALRDLAFVQGAIALCAAIFLLAFIFSGPMRLF